MSEPKPSTADILAKIRAQKTGAGGKPAPAPVAATVPAPEVAAAEAPAEPKAAPKPKPAPTSVSKPGSTSDILAKIRAQKGGAVAAPPVTEAPTPKAAPAAKPVVAVASGAPKPSVEEMLNAVRGKTVGASESVSAIADSPVLPVKPVLPPVPVKPPAAKDKKAAAGTTRRSFISVCFDPLVLAFGVMAVTSQVWVLALARFMFPNVLVEPPTTFKIGPPSDYPLGGVSTKWLAARGVWIVHTDQYKGRNLIYALASVCTHLGCTPNWLEGEQKYKCPCHGSGFYVNGINFEGPAPRPLERVGIKLAADGQLEVDKSVKFQEEMGQWEDSNSFVDGSLV